MAYQENVIVVENLATGERVEIEGHYITPRWAVIVAHAHAHGDFKPWEFLNRYGPVVIEGEHTIACGDWTTLKKMQPKESPYKN